MRDADSPAGLGESVQDVDSVPWRKHRQHEEFIRHLKPLQEGLEMSLKRVSQSPWMLPAVSVVSLGIGALCFGPLGTSSGTSAHAAPRTGPGGGQSVAQSLSQDFREISRDVLPGVVSIETRQNPPAAALGKGKEGADGELENPLENSPFNDLFRNNPKFRELFENAPRNRPMMGQGSGFVIDPDGLIVTNNHVVEGADLVRVRMHDGTEYLATDIKTDPRSDLAILRIKPTEKLHALKLGDSDQAQTGDLVLAVGSPFGLDMTVTSGIISGKGRGPGIMEREDFIQTDAAVNPGNSGGPLLNLDGEVIGVNTAISSRSGGYDGVSFAVPSDMVRFVTGQLVAHGQVKRGYLGVAIQKVNSDLAQQFNIKVGQGAIVGQILPSSPAAEAGLETGDVLLSLNERKVTDPRTLQGIVEQLELGKSYVLKLLRDGKALDLSVTIREMPKNFTASGKEVTPIEPEQPAAPTTSEIKDLGLEVQELAADMAKQLGYAAETKGLVITGVKADSPAAEAGLQTGMLIEKVGSKKVSTLEEFQAATKDISVEKGVLFLLRTPQGSRFVVVGKE